MGGGADQLDAAFMRLVIGLCALETWQERVMDVDAAPGQLGRQVVGQNLHVARQHHEIRPRLLDHLPDRVLLLALGVLCRRQGVERNFAEIAARMGLARMVGDDRGRVHRKLADPPAIENIDETVIGFRDQEHHLAPRGAIAHLPVHAEALGERREAGLQRLQFDREVGGGEHHPHEELPGFDILELLGIENVLPVMGKKRRDGRNDAGTIRAGQSQHVLVIGHGAA